MDLPLDECVTYSINAIDIVGSQRQPHPLLPTISYLCDERYSAHFDTIFTPKLIETLGRLDLLGHDVEENSVALDTE